MSAAATEADVAVVGAGLSGLSAARALERAGCRVVVLEARERVGGRTVCVPLGDDGAVLELGGQWAGHLDTRPLLLAQEAGVERYATYDEGARLIDLGGSVKRYGGWMPRVAPHALLDVGIAMWRFDRASRGIPATWPWQAKHARRLDRRTLGDWIQGTLRTRAGRALFEIASAGIWAAEPAEIPLLHALAFNGITSDGRMQYMVETLGGAQHWRFVGGSEALSRHLAAGLADDAIALEQPVRRIEQARDRVTVVADDLRVTARRAIVALPPPMAVRIAYEPGLPGDRDHALQRWGMGAASKFLAVYDEPFWRADGLSGQAICDRGPFQATYDNSPRGGRPGVLLGFSLASRALELARLSPADRRAAVLDGFARLFGPAALQPRAFVEKQWAEDVWARGCFHALPATGVLSRLGPTLRAPVGRLHWAGTETSIRHFGGMDGAIDAGERAANEVLAAEGRRHAEPAGVGEPSSAIGLSSDKR